jgi:hypothetical protein
VTATLICYDANLCHGFSLGLTAHSSVVLDEIENRLNVDSSANTINKSQALVHMQAHWQLLSVPQAAAWHEWTFHMAREIPVPKNLLVLRSRFHNSTQGFSLSFVIDAWLLIHTAEHRGSIILWTPK